MSNPAYSKVRLNYEHPDQGDDPHADPYARADLDLANTLFAVVSRHYPGHPWVVKVNHKQGIVQIQIAQLMGETNWFVVPLWRLSTDPNFMHIVRGCGEILERYQIPRSAFSPAEFLTALNAIPKVKRRYGLVPQ